MTIEETLDQLIKNLAELNLKVVKEMLESKSEPSSLIIDTLRVLKENAQVLNQIIRESIRR